ncbi:MAG: tetratricopeptide repeat protein [Candidatus Aminicenantes bacterium]|nr:tetratricopeptide repeat protein [Candidatus Aminicenantes bacterium]
MKSKNIYVIILVFLLIWGAALDASAQQGRGKGRIKGTVVDEAGNPLAGVKIVAQHLKFNTLFEGKSDEKGKWAIAGLGTGAFRITASMEGFESTYQETNVSQFSRNNPSIEFALVKTQAAPSGIPALEDESALAVFEEGNQLFQQGLYAEAAAKFGEFLERNPTIYQVNLNIGNCYRQLKEYDKALETYQIILDKVMEEKGSYEGDDSAARAMAGIGETYMLQGNLEKASEFMKKAIDLFPSDETLAFNVGEIFFNEGKADDAIEYYKLSAKIKENWAPPYRQLGYAYLNKGEYQLAIDSFKKFLELAPDDPQAPSIEGLIPKLEEMIKN